MKGETLGPGLEFDLIRRFLERSAAPGPEVIVGPGDDCAVIAAPRIAISVDLSMEGVHFRREWLAPAEIGYRAAAAALSDLAAMAAAPIGALASLALPATDPPETAVSLMDGVRDAVEGVGAALLGGDLVRSSGAIVLDIVALGSAERPVLRSGARPGDELWVTGVLGGAAAAVAAWRAGGEPDPAARRAFARPQPRIREAIWLAERQLLHALLDISDGVAGDLRHLAAASEVGIVVDEARIPIHPAAARAGQGLHLALAGGEDYELCFAAPAGAVDALAAEFSGIFDLPLHRIGRVVEGREVQLRRASGALESLESSGFEHFHER